VTAIAVRSGVAAGTSREVLRFGGRTGKVRTRIRVPARPQRLAVAHSGVWVATEPVLRGPGQLLRYGNGFLWTTLEGEDAVARISADGRTMRTVAAGHAPSQSVVARGRLFVANRNDNTVLVFDPETLKPIGEPVDVGLNPFAMVADDRSVWVTGLGDNTLTRIDYR
jgi:YVTN family beta-propeller protein